MYYSVKLFNILLILLFTMSDFNYIKTNIKYEHVISIGNWCITAAVLKNNGYRTFSTPFDWVYSNINMVLECTQDKFNKFLNKSYYAPVPDNLKWDINNKQCYHTYFDSKYGFESLFNHHNPLLMKDYSYFIRGVNRFLDLIKSDKPTLYVNIAKEKDNLYPYYALLNEMKCKDSRIVHFYVHNDGCKVKPIVNIVRNEHNLLYVDIDMIGIADGVEFTNKLDEDAFLQIIKLHDRKL